MPPETLQIVAWLAVLALLVVSWVLAQRWRHERLQPLAAFLLFTSALALVLVAVFSALAWLLTLLFPQGVGTVVTILILIVAALAGGLAGRLIVRNPQWRRGPR